MCSRTSWWSVCMLKSQRILTFSCSQTFPGTCSYHLSVTSNAYFLHKHQWTCSFCNAIMSIHKLCGLLILPHSCTTCIFSWQPCLSIFVFIACAAVSNPSDSFFNSPLLQLRAPSCYCSCFLLVVIVIIIIVKGVNPGVISLLLLLFLFTV